MATIAPTPVALPASITVPADGQPNTAASVVGPIQHVANGIAYVAAGTTTTVATLAALKAIAAPTNGMVRHVKGYGLYVFDTASVEAVFSPHYLAADDATAGKWIGPRAGELVRTIWVPGSSVRWMTDAGVPSLSSTGKFFDASHKMNAVGGAMKPLENAAHATNAFGFHFDLQPYVSAKHGARIATATLYWYSAAADGGTPPAPRFGLYRSGRTGASPTVDALLSSGSGFVTDSGGSFATVDRTVLYTADQNHTIDATSYAYGAVIYDELGALATAGNTFHGLLLSFTSP